MDGMSEQEARQRLMEGGYFVALGVPPGVDFGVDLKSYKTGAQFKGVKMIPAGLHLAHYGTGEGEKQCFFFRSGAGTVAATQWDASAEDLVDAAVALPEGALRSLRTSVLHLQMDANLGPYPFEQRAAWQNLSNCVSDSVLERCGIPLGAKVLAGSSAAEAGEPGGERLDGGVADAGAEESKGAGESADGMELVPHFPHVGRVARFCELPKRTAAGWTWQSSAESAATAAEPVRVNPQEITKRNMDGSAALGEILASAFGGNWMELLGELQVAFVLFISLSSLRGFRHWQELSALLCRCGDALATHPALFTAFIRMLHAHLRLVPEDFFDVELSKDNFLAPCLSALLQNILPDESNLSPGLVDAAKRLLKFLRQRFGLFTATAGDAATVQRSTTGPSDKKEINTSAKVALAGTTFMETNKDSTVVSEAFVPAEGMMDSDGDDRGAGVAETEEAGRCRGSGGATPGEELSSMQLELCEEDQPAVVPYEEVARVLGGEALSGLPGQSSANATLPNDAGQTSTAESSPKSPRKKQETEGRVPPTLSSPSAEHSQRWQNIDRLLSAARLPAGTGGSGLRVPHAPISSVDRETLDGTKGSGFGAAADTSAVTTASVEVAAFNSAAGTGPSKGRSAKQTGYAVSAANRFPLLFASTAANEDVMMAAARLVSEGEEGTVDTDRGVMRGVPARPAVVAQAVAFLEEIAGREDGGADAWLLSTTTGGAGDVPDGSVRAGSGLDMGRIC